MVLETNKMLQLERWYTIRSIRDRDMDREELTKKQKEHLKKVAKRVDKPCRHNQCTECHGTGVKRNGQTCVHMIHCDCPKCVPYTM